MRAPLANLADTVALKQDSVAIWEYESLHRGALPDAIEAAPALEVIANSLISAADVNKQVLTTIPRELIELVQV